MDLMTAIQAGIFHTRTVVRNISVAQLIIEVVKTVKSLLLTELIALTKVFLHIDLHIDTSTRLLCIICVVNFPLFYSV